jgi:hypothetical protein
MNPDSAGMAADSRRIEKYSRGTKADRRRMELTVPEWLCAKTDLLCFCGSSKEWRLFMALVGIARIVEFRVRLHIGVAAGDEHLARR